jgi:hypothetical protein
LRGFGVFVFVDFVARMDGLRVTPAKRRLYNASRMRQKKAPDVSIRGSFPDLRPNVLLDHLDLVGLHALLALHGDERHALAFLERLEAGALDRAEVHEEVRAALGGDETEALGIVEPLDGSGLTIRHLDISFVKSLLT